MGTFSIADQSIVMGTILIQDDVPVSSLPVTSISFYSPDATAHYVVMELRIPTGSEVAGYLLKFDRNGMFMPPVEPIAAAPASELATVASAPAVEEDEEPSPRSHGRRR